MQAKESNEGELAAFVGYACAFPAKFLCLVDTYDVIRCVMCYLLILNINIIVSIAAYCAVSIVSDISQHKQNKTPLKLLLFF